MTKLEEVLNKLYATEGMSLEEQITITNGLPDKEARDEYIKLLRALNEEL